jgi:SpoVK/Ycf46/Vps4 family AAA+-type ATPase
MMGSNGSNLINDGGLFISLSASEIVRSEVGRSEKLIASAFEMARKSAPAVIFIDEFQALFTSRDDESGQSKGSGRLSSVLLQCMDDISKWENADRLVGDTDPKYTNKRVVVLAATNTPWMVDKAFLRAGRFDRVSTYAC